MMPSLPLLRITSSPFFDAISSTHESSSAMVIFCGVVGNSELHMLSAELGGPIYQLRKQAEQMLMDIAQRGIDKGLFKVPHPWLAVAAIGGMGLRVAFWFSPQAGIEAAMVADTYAEFALRIMGASAPGN